MPELPEVETVVHDLRPRLVGRRLASVQVSGLKLRRAWSAEWDAALTGRRVRDVSRRGKWIVVALDDDSRLVGLGWDRILAATGLGCGAAIPTPESTATPRGSATGALTPPHTATTPATRVTATPRTPEPMRLPWAQRGRR